MGKIILGKIAITFALTIMICLPHYAADNISSTKGDDTLIGGPGNDIYIYHKGDGNDTIIDPGGYNTIRLPDMTIENVQNFTKKGSDLLIQFQNSKTDTTSIGSLLIKNFYTESKPRIKIIFSDKSTWDNYEIVD